MQLKAIVILLFLTFLGIVLADNSKQELEEFEAALMTLRANQADLLFPTTYARLESEVWKLQQQIAGAQLQIGVDRFQQLRNDLEYWSAVSEGARKFLINILEMREHVLAAHGEEFAATEFEAAESTLVTTAEFYREQKMNKANQALNEARRLYQLAEFQTVRNNVLGEVRILIQESTDLNAAELAPQSYARTLALLETVEDLIKRNRFDDSKLSSTSRELLDSAGHLLNLVMTLNLVYQAKDEGEKQLLNTEAQLARLSRELEYIPQFSEGQEKIIEDLMLKIKNLKKDNESLHRRSRQLENEKYDLERELYSQKTSRERQQYLEEKIRRVRSAFKGPVLEDQHYLTLILDSLRFDFDRAEVDPANEDKLQGVISAVQEFPVQSLQIRYIYYTADNVTYYRNLARKRAEAIRDYLEAHLSQENLVVRMVGIVYHPAFQSYQSISHVEIVINFPSFLDSALPHNYTREGVDVSPGENPSE